MRREERGRHAYSQNEPIARCAWQPGDYYTVPLRPFEFPTTVSVSFSSSLFLWFVLHPPSLTSPSLSCLYLSIFRSCSCLFHSSLRLSSARFLCRRHHHPSPSLDHPFSLALVHLSFLYLSFCLSYPLFIFLLLVYAAHRAIAVSLAPPSNRRRAPADFAFKFGKFAGVGKWAAGMVSNTRARARPPIHYV